MIAEPLRNERIDGERTSQRTKGDKQAKLILATIESESFCRALLHTCVKHPFGRHEPMEFPQENEICPEISPQSPWPTGTNLTRVFSKTKHIRFFEFVERFHNRLRLFLSEESFPTLARGLSANKLEFRL